MARNSSLHLYRREGAETLIEVRLQTVNQLFHTLDPAPFREKDLDQVADQYLQEACEEAGSRRPLRIVVYLPEPEARGEVAMGLAGSVHHYYEYRDLQVRTDIFRLLRYGAVSFAIGCAFLIACLVLRGWFVAHPIGMDPIILDEGLLILGWVAMWRPTEVLLYDWWPLARRRKLFQRLMMTPVEVRSSG